MRLSDFDYALPPERIAQTPIEPRDAARLLVLDRGTRKIQHRQVRDLPDLLAPGDLLVANRSRVLPARVLGTLRGGGRAELLLLRRLEPTRWEVLGRPARRLRSGDIVRLQDGSLATVVAVRAEGVREISVEDDAALLDSVTA